MRIICGGCGKHTYTSCQALRRVFDPGFHPAANQHRLRCTLCGSAPSGADISPPLRG